MAKANSEVHESNRFFESITASAPFINLLQKSKVKTMPVRRNKFRSDGENVVPTDPNIQISDPPLSPSIPFFKKSALKPKESTASVIQENVSEAPDAPVKVVVRIRPVNGLGIGDTLVRKVSEESVVIAERKFTFDSVMDSNSTQEDVYRLIGAPLVKDSLSGYNTTIVAYGKTGSGKTYTMWGPPSAMIEGPSSSGLQGIVPRIFKNVFSEIQKEQDNTGGRQTNYQFRCSFLEVYGEKIGDLLHPIQRNLLKDDPKNGFYVENLSEEYVNNYEDVTQILIKGLSNRKIGATSVNSKSSRSHIMFTCIIESWCKETSSKCFGSSKTSRISLVDLAGFERSAPEDASRQHLKERKYIMKTISQLGNLVNILTDGTQSGKTEDASYRSSSLTHVLRDSFGGNAKLSIICAVSPDNKSKSETLSTLRFGLRAKFVKNEPVINEITEDDVNDLSDQIRQLKEELMRAKSSTCDLLSSGGQFRGGNVRESLNHLRRSLNRSLILPRIDKDSETDLCIDKDDVKELKLQIDNIRVSHDENVREDSENGESSALLYSAEGCETGFSCEHYLSCSEDSENEEINSCETHTKLPHLKNVTQVEEVDQISKNSIVTDPLAGDLQDPVFSESPKIKSSQRKSLIFLSNHLSNQKDAIQTSKSLDVLRQSHQQSDLCNSSLRSSTIFPGPTESLAASLHRGLQIIDYHQKNSAKTRSSASFSFEHLALKPSLSVDKGSTFVETSPVNCQSSDPSSASFVCIKCQSRESEDSLKTQIITVDASEHSNGLGIPVTKDVEKDLALAAEREKELGSKCNEQAAEIEYLRKLLEQHMCEANQADVRECNNSSSFSDTKKQLPPINEDEHDKCRSKDVENQLVAAFHGDENLDSEVVKEQCEIKEVQEDLNHSMKKSFSAEEKEALIKEIETLKTQLQMYTDTPTRRSTDKLRSSLLSQSIQFRKSCVNSQGISGGEFEKERQKWMEMESDWISLTDELRIDIEINRHRAEQVELELRLEKKCTEELDDAFKRSVIGQARMIEHYAELQETYNDIVLKHRAIMESIAEVKRAAAKAGSKGRHGSRFAKAFAAELSSSRAERERERELLKKENQNLKIQLKDTAEAVHAAGELLVRLREVEEAASVAEEKNTMIEEENDKLKKQMEKLKRKHKMEIITMKQYLAQSRLPEAALQRPLYREDSDVKHDDHVYDDDQAWRAEFGAIYQDHYSGFN
ncbi:kinesin-like protein KIN-12F isoform X2 [Primulina huaijiensis]|uniref:kinesin-like protein KIN-12F isoform X2 n=1 Tax=Primulina huaijiensis TaxID=1492673 RepID=UPI003CC768A6